MDINAISTAISTVGFPICMCGMLFWYMIKQREAHKEEIEKMTNALNNNTKALTKLIAKIGADECDSTKP